MKYSLSILFCFLLKSSFSIETEMVCLEISNSQNVICLKSFEQVDRPNPVFKLFQKKQRNNKRITAAILAFPFPFGMVGLHRIYLGTKPYVPVAYIGSLGGVFGILPLTDFCAIVFDNDFDFYKNNGKVIMWIRD